MDNKRLIILNIGCELNVTLDICTKVLFLVLN